MRSDILNEKKLIEKIKNYEPKPLGNKVQFAVLIPLIEVDGEDHILYQVRSNHISQPGETSFPGGKMEASETPEETAVRETVEELNVKTENIEVFGEMDYIVNGGQMIHSFAGRIHHTPVEEIKFNNEVQRIFTVPLDYFIEHQPTFYKISAKHVMHDDFPVHLINNGKDYNFHTTSQAVPFYNIPNEVLWGFTAQFTYEFSKILRK